jgi:glycerate 2-kinase
MDPKRLLTKSLAAEAQAETFSTILAAGLAAVEPAEAVRRYLRREGEILVVGERRYELDEFERVYVVAIGKAGTPMARAAAEVLGERLSAGIAVVKDHPSVALPAEISLFIAGHPVPDERGVLAAQQLAELLDEAGPKDLVVVLISGGGSALLPLPVDGIRLDEIQELTSLLLRSGASIDEINALRKHLEQLKGGGLARRAAPAQLVTLILSDVVGNPLDVIASGPTVADSSSFDSAFAVLNRYDLLEQAPASIVEHLRAGIRGEIPDTPKAGDPLFDSVYNLIIGSNEQAARAIIAAAADAGMQTLLLSTYFQGEARELGRMVAAIARQLALSDLPIPKPACIVLGGESTVTLRGHGKGGRNQELALGAVADMAGLERVMLVSLATDGGDGPTDAAGAIVTGQTFQRARDLQLDSFQFLANNNAYTFFAALEDLLLPGPTETNVNDLICLFAW